MCSWSCTSLKRVFCGAIRCLVLSAQPKSFVSAQEPCHETVHDIRTVTACFVLAYYIPLMATDDYSTLNICHAPYYYMATLDHIAITRLVPADYVLSVSRSRACALANGARGCCGVLFGEDLTGGALGEVNGVVTGIGKGAQLPAGALNCRKSPNGE